MSTSKHRYSYCPIHKLDTQKGVPCPKCWHNEYFIARIINPAVIRSIRVLALEVFK